MTITNTTGTKAVNIRNNNGSISAMYVQIYNGQEQVLESKDFSTEKRATNWANRILS